ncbi:MAG: hypothetical protein ACE5FL_10605 [Myxococcota bacterium]
MGIDIRLENEVGEEIATLLDYEDSLEKITLECVPKRSPTLRFIDAFGNTVFNRLQIPYLIRELEIARENLSDESALQFVEDLLALARRCRNEVNTYLKFYGG